MKGRLWGLGGALYKPVPVPCLESPFLRGTEPFFLVTDFSVGRYAQCLLALIQAAGSQPLTCSKVMGEISIPTAWLHPDQ